MQITSKKAIENLFNNDIYRIDSPIFISSDIFFDGGIDLKNSLKEKAEFYSLAEKMSEIIKNTITTLNEEIYISDFLCEHKKMYADWSDLKKKELFLNISKMFRKGKCYKLTLPQDSKLIDLILESNFKYLSFFSFFLPISNIIIQPTCHTELIVYSKKTAEIKSILKNIVKSYTDIKIS